MIWVSRQATETYNVQLRLFVYQQAESATEHREVNFVRELYTSEVSKHASLAVKAQGKAASSDAGRELFAKYLCFI